MSKLLRTMKPTPLRSFHIQGQSGFQPQLAARQNLKECPAECLIQSASIHADSAHALQFGEEVLHNEESARLRLRVLIIVQLIFSMGPLVTAWISAQGDWIMPVMCALPAVNLSQLTLLSFWVGMGGNSVIVRALGVLVGSAYIAIWPIAAKVASLPFVNLDLWLLVSEFLIAFSASAAFVSFLSGCFVVWRRKCTELVHLSESSANFADLRVRYSIFHLLIFISACSLLLGLMRIARLSDETDIGNEVVPLAAFSTIMLLGHVINSICASWAPLSRNPPWSRIALAVVVAFLLGAAQSFSSGLDAFSWRMVISTCLIPVLSTAIVIASLLVVRSCGYRLIPKEPPQTGP